MHGTRCNMKVLMQSADQQADGMFLFKLNVAATSQPAVHLTQRSWQKISTGEKLNL